MKQSRRDRLRVFATQNLPDFWPDRMEIAYVCHVDPRRAVLRGTMTAYVGLGAEISERAEEDHFGLAKPRRTPKPSMSEPVLPPPTIPDRTASVYFGSDVSRTMETGLRSFGWLVGKRRLNWY